MMVTHWPGRTGVVLRRHYWKRRLRHLGERVEIGEGVYFQNPAFITIGENSWIDRNVTLLAGPSQGGREVYCPETPATAARPGELHIGADVHIAPGCIISAIGGVYISDRCCLSAGVKMYSFSHHFRSREDPARRGVSLSSVAPPEVQSLISAPIYLGKHTAVALQAVVLPGACIEADSFVTINSVVGAECFPPNSLIAGSPARRVGPRYRDPLQSAQARPGGSV
jgi:acetyltransferase-like isoleucine patch superfamily enzyme